MIDNPLTAEAGLELNAAIATEVLGWDRTPIGCWIIDPAKQTLLGPNNWRPSTDANDALVVAEKAGIPDTYLAIFHYKKVWYMRYSDADQLDRNIADADTLPLLICRAALYFARGGR